MRSFVKGSLSLFVARVFSGLNVNALGYLLPVWIAPVACVTLRLVFGATVFCLMSIFAKPEIVKWNDRFRLIMLGSCGIFGYMTLYALSLSYTTPVNFAIFNAMQPLWVVVVSAVIYRESVNSRKLLGLSVGFVGALLCILSEPVGGVARDALLGNMLAVLASVIYAIYLVLSARMVGHLQTTTILRYTFSSGALVALIVAYFVGLDIPLFTDKAGWQPVLVLLFVLIFPTVLTYILIPIGMKYLRSTVVALYGYVTLVVATVVSYLLGLDRFDPVILLSLVLIAVSIYWVSIADND